MPRTTATSTQGTAGASRRPTITMAIEAIPIATAAPTVFPSANPRTKADTSSTSPSASVENPKTLGSWLTITVSAMPLR